MSGICPDCEGRMIVMSIGYPVATMGSYTLYGCPNCGRVLFDYDDSFNPYNPNKVEVHYDPTDINQHAISS